MPLCSTRHAVCTCTMNAAVSFTSYATTTGLSPSATLSTVCWRCLGYHIPRRAIAVSPAHTRRPHCPRLRPASRAWTALTRRWAACEPGQPCACERVATPPSDATCAVALTASRRPPRRRHRCRQKRLWPLGWGPRPVHLSRCLRHALTRHGAGRPSRHRPLLHSEHRGAVVVTLQPSDHVVPQRHWQLRQIHHADDPHPSPPRRRLMLDWTTPL
jgi:hypothetical protein